MRPALVPARLAAAAGVRRRRSRPPTASTGATTRCTTRRPRAPTRPTRTGRRARCEFREMVKGINGAGLRVVMDVVYNHTPAAGQDPKSILDRIVPGYYQRLDPATGAVETSTCCANTATEHLMMGKLHGRLGAHVGDAVQGRRLPLRPDGPPAQGADGASCAASSTRSRAGATASTASGSTSTARAGTSARSPTTPASCRPASSTWPAPGSATFSDRLRDAVRGGGPFDADPRIQGFASGLYTDPNGVARQRHAGRAARAAAALPGPDQARPRRQPARLHVRRQRRADGQGLAGRLQRPARRLRRRSERDDHLRRRARQRDAVRRPAAQAAARHRRWPTACA